MNMIFYATVVLCLAAFGPAVSGEDDDFQCDAIYQPDVKNITLTIPRTHIPSDSMTHFCYRFRIPTDQDYHVIAAKTNIDNTMGLHHAILRICQEEVAFVDTPFKCEDSTGTIGCREVVYFWSHGLPYSECFPDETGFLIRKGSTGIVNLELHYTNFEHATTWTDASGMTLYYTSHLRATNARVLQLGQSRMLIPPGLPNAAVFNNCTSRCTSKILKGPIEVFSVHPHMHLFGFRQNVSIQHPGGDMELVWAFNTPHNNHTFYRMMFDPPFTINPGDTVRMSCEYNTVGKTEPTPWGFGTDKEHCYSTFFVYPAENLLYAETACSQIRDDDLCDVDLTCNRLDHMNSSSALMQTILPEVLNYCPGHIKCNDYCKSMINLARVRTRCMRDEWQTTRYAMLAYADEDVKKFVEYVDDCDNKKAT